MSISDRLFLSMLVEATRILEEHLVRDPRDIDLGLIFGIGFPPFKGGLLFWADTIGLPKIVESLKAYEPLGERYQPTALLVELASSGGRVPSTTNQPTENNMENAVVVDCVRTAIGRSQKDKRLFPSCSQR